MGVKKGFVTSGPSYFLVHYFPDTVCKAEFERIMKTELVQKINTGIDMMQAFKCVKFISIIFYSIKALCLSQMTGFLSPKICNNYFDIVSMTARFSSR